MAVTHLLQDFGTSIAGGEVLTLVSDSQQEEQNIAQYERGYAAGWEDSLALQIEEKSKLSENLRRNLEDLNFTFHEAHQQLLTSLLPVLEAMTDQILPEVMREAAGPAITELLRQMCGNADDFAVGISACPDEVPQVRPIVEHALGGGIEVSGDPGLSAGQIALRVGASERMLDPQATLQGIRTALAGVSHGITAEVQHG